MKTKTTVFIISIGLLVLGALICFGTMIAIGFDSGILNEGDSFEQREYVASADAFKSIKFDDSNKRIDVVPSKDDKIRIAYSDNESNHYLISELGETLSFEYSEKKHWYEYIGITWYYEKHDITISIPESYLGDIDVNTNNGRIEIHDVTIPGKFRADTSNANIVADNIKGSDINFTTSNGSVELDHVIAENVVDVKTSNASIETRNLQGKDISLDTSNGHIEFDRITSDRIYFDTSNARITGAIAGRMTDYHITSHTSNASNNLPEEFDEGGNKSLYADTSNGSIDINFIE